MLEDIKSYPIYQAIQRRSLAPFWEQFNAQNRGQTLRNFTQQGLPSIALGMTAKGGMKMPLPRVVNKTPFYNLSPNVGSMLRGYERTNKGFNPEFYYKNGGSVVNATSPQNQRALAASYLSRFNLKNWANKPRQ